MKRTIGAVLASSLAATVMAAAPHQAAVPRQGDTPSLEVEPEEDFPIPPIPPDADNPYLAAPVPDTAFADPAARPGPTGTQISPGFYQPRDYNIGQGYLSGSTIAGQQERRAAPVPSLRLKVPLE